MHSLATFLAGAPVAQAVLALSVAVAAGLLLGSVKVKGVSLSVGGVLFAGLLFGHLGLRIEPSIMDFVRDFGLILFVYSIGLQVGPGFFDSLRRQGMSLNLLAAAIVLLGTGIAVLIARFGGVPLPAVLGLLSGAVTNTPSLGAAEQAFKDVGGGGTNPTELLGLGYALAYPFGILGILLTMHAVRLLFRIDPEKEAEQHALHQERQARPLAMQDFEITNPNLTGKSVDELLRIAGTGVVVTRVFHAGKQELATADTKIAAGDVVHAVGSAQKLEAFRIIVGKVADVALPTLPSRISYRAVIVTRKEVVGREIEGLDLDDYGVIATRVIRSGVEFTPQPGLRLQFGDRLMLVGEDPAIARAAQELGDSAEDLEKPQIVPVFVGIALGVLVGSWPVSLFDMPAPVKLGLAGGPLLVAILLSHIGKVGPLLVYMPNAGKTLLREFGISLFLACVGLKAGEKLFPVLFSDRGLRWVALAALITVVPLLVVGIAARALRKVNYVSLCGLLSGSMTDPPALAYATQVFKSDAPSAAYATVYPLTMLLRVVIAQVFVLAAAA